MFAGKPIIAYSIETAKKSGLFKKIVVSTDSAKIAQIADDYGAHFLPRPEELANDTATTDEVILHALASERKDYKYACCIYPTAPLLKLGYFKFGYELLKKFGNTCIVSVTTDLVDAGQFYWINVKKYLKTGKILSNGSFPIIVPDVIDINTMADWNLAEKKFIELNKIIDNNQKRS